MFMSLTHSSMSMIGMFEVESLWTNSGVAKAMTGLESAICLAISEVVLSGLTVVMMAPSDKMEREMMGK